jgi:hypothetical protein
MRLEAEQVATDSGSNQKAVKLTKRSEKMFPGEQFPHFCSRHNGPFQASCFGFFLILVD